MERGEFIEALNGINVVEYQSAIKAGSYKGAYAAAILGTYYVYQNLVRKDDFSLPSYPNIYSLESVADEQAIQVARSLKDYGYVEAGFTELDNFKTLMNLIEQSPSDSGVKFLNDCRKLDSLLAAQGDVNLPSDGDVAFLHINVPLASLGGVVNDEYVIPTEVLASIVAAYSTLLGNNIEGDIDMTAVVDAIEERVETAKDEILSVLKADGDSVGPRKVRLVAFVRTNA